MQRVGTSPFDGVVLRAQQDTERARQEHPLGRPTWALGFAS